MDRIVVNCKKCGRPLVAITGTKARKCAACGTTTRIPLNNQIKAVPIKDAIAVAAGMAKKTESSGEPAVIKCRSRIPKDDD
ncbi:MAG TPA: hypothetical protein VKM55_06185 [Candidatus Lokiarchaeia archaeon]|nr:hypothetical protein [Candidatus Lokiarchaeia archaeon]